jgi:kynurenine formamidase
MKYIDLTLPLENGMRGVDIQPCKTIKADGWNATTLSLYSHAGTHMDAPLHFDVNENGIDKYPVERFFTPCFVVDLNGIKPGTEIAPDDLGDIKNELKPGEGLLFRTGWSQYVGKEQYRKGIPGISKELALWCAKNGVATIAVEPPSVADVTDIAQLTAIHQILLEADIVIVEGLTNLEKVTKSKVQLVVLPLKIKNGDGSPCRAIAIENE